MHLLVDDLRNLRMDLIARNSQSAQKLMLAMEGITHLYLDHDLGDESEQNGYQFCEWCIDNNLLPDYVILVTANPAGRLKMKRALENSGFSTKDNYRFVRNHD